MFYQINLPNDFGCEHDYEAMLDDLDLEEEDGQEVDIAAFERIRQLWPKLDPLKETDFGMWFQSATPPPDNLPCWVWVHETDEDGEEVPSLV